MAQVVSASAPASPQIARLPKEMPDATKEVCRRACCNVVSVASAAVAAGNDDLGDVFVTAWALQGMWEPIPSRTQGPGGEFHTPQVSDVSGRIGRFGEGTPLGAIRDPGWYGAISGTGDFPSTTLSRVGNIRTRFTVNFGRRPPAPFFAQRRRECAARLGL